MHIEKLSGGIELLDIWINIYYFKIMLSTFFKFILLN